MAHNISHVNLRLLWMVILVIRQILMLTAAVDEGTLEVARHTARRQVRTYLVLSPSVVESRTISVVEAIIVMQFSILQLL